jgi:uncharacterized protein (DUF2147 family)
MKAPLVAAAAILTMQAAAVAGPAGKWRVADGTAHIQISSCGQALCGSIAWTNDGGGGHDDKNPNPAQRGRPLLGLPILHLQQGGDNLWTGSVYNANDGQNYAARMYLQSESVLKIEGCVQGTNICGEESWSRVR